MATYATPQFPRKLVAIDRLSVNSHIGRGGSGKAQWIQRLEIALFTKFASICLSDRLITSNYSTDRAQLAHFTQTEDTNPPQLSVHH